VFLCLLNAARLNTGMKNTTFKEWLARHDEGYLLPDRSLLKGMPRINTTPFSQAKRKRLHIKPVQKPKPFAPTIRAVAEIVPQHLIAKLPVAPIQSL
jgi:hypothetical protein